MINCYRAYNQQYLNFKREADKYFSDVNGFFDATEADRSEVTEKAGARIYGMNAVGSLLGDDATT